MINIENIIKLSNGLRVANFSSPHSFEFEDGSVLPAVSVDDCRYLAMDAVEERMNDHTIKVFFLLGPNIATRVAEWHLVYFKHKYIDIVIVPRPMIDVLRNNGWDDEQLLNSPFRTIRLVDREKKICSINKFCI